MKFKSEFEFGDAIEFVSPIYGNGQGRVDSIVLHPDSSVSYIVDIQHGSRFGGSSPNLFGGLKACDMQLRKGRLCEKKQGQQASTTFFFSSVTFNDNVEFHSALNGDGQGRIIEIVIDLEMHHYFNIEGNSGEIVGGILADDIRSVSGSVSGTHEFIIEYPSKSEFS
jgi:hypothetical protein